MYDFKEVYKYSKDLTVLYIEDDKDLLEATCDLLENFFASVTAAFDGQDGLEKYKKQKFDLVITDINMPRMDGKRLAKEIRQINKEQPIIIISAYNESGRIVELIQLGISNFVMKPIEMDQFLYMLYTVCKNISNQKVIDAK